MISSIRSGIVLILALIVFTTLYGLSEVMEKARKSRAKQKEDSTESETETSDSVDVEVEIEVETPKSTSSPVVSMTPLNTVEGITPMALKALKEAGINTLEDAKKKSSEELTAIKGVGAKTVETIFAA